jgi:hypothetical protein
MMSDTFEATYDGATAAAPLYMENGPGAKGAFFVATVSNNVYALDETTGARLWMHNIGPAPAKPGVPCGNVFPVGILGTPVIDEVSRTIFVAGAVGDATTIMRHEVHALSVDTGLERPGWPVNVSALTAPGNVAFNSPAQNQRGALALVNGILYVPYGGHAGDCGQYRGWVVSINTANPSQTGAWATGGFGEGIWAPGGLASAGVGVFAVTGNGIMGPATHLDSEEVVHVTGLSQVDRAKGIFFPGTWRSMDATDMDFGSSNAVAFRLEGSTPSVLIAAVSKNAQFFLLDPANLGGMDGYLAKLAPTPLAGQPAGFVKSSPNAYMTPAGVHVFLPVQDGLAFCPGASRVHSVSMAISPGSPPTAKVAWCGVAGGQGIVTTTDGTNNPIVWVYDGGLYAMEGTTGQILYANGGGKPCPGMNPTQTPIAVKGRIIFAGTGGLCSYSPH